METERSDHSKEGLGKQLISGVKDLSRSQPRNTSDSDSSSASPLGVRSG